jgi:murein DD-endopeptidase MepM/ murein hydrolase activator NlpD
MKSGSVRSVFAHKNIEQLQKENERLKEAAQGFEATFLKQLYNKMKQGSTSTVGAQDKSNARQIFEGMLYNKYAEIAAKTGTVGISDVIMKQYGHDIDTQKGSLVNKHVKNGPVAGRVSSDFGFRTHPFTNQKVFHYGVDIVPENGNDSIKSPLPGIVRYSGKYGSYGNIIVVDHAGGYRTFYGHNAKNLVKKGDYVLKGDIIGKVGSSGRSTGKHLHFELRKNGQPIDPVSLL